MKKTLLAIGILMIAFINFNVYENLNIDINSGMRILLGWFAVGLVIYSLYDELNLKNVTQKSIINLLLILLTNVSLEIVFLNYNLQFLKSFWGVLNDLSLSLLLLIFIKNKREKKD